MPSTKFVTQKLLLKTGSRALVLNAPPGYLEQIAGDVHVEQEIADGPFDFIQLFATRKADLLSEGPRLRQALKPNGLLWVSDWSALRAKVV